MFRRTVQAPAPYRWNVFQSRRSKISRVYLHATFLLHVTVHEAYTNVKGDTIYARCNWRNYKRYNDEGIFKIALRLYKERVITLSIFPSVLSAHSLNQGFETHGCHYPVSSKFAVRVAGHRGMKDKSRNQPQESSFMAIVCHVGFIYLNVTIGRQVSTERLR